MTEYDYFISGFQSPLDAEYVRQLILAQSSLSSTFSSLETNSDTVEGINGYDLTVFFTAALSSDAQTLLSGLMATYMTSVSVAKMKKLTSLNKLVQDFIEAHYPTLTRIQFMNLYMLARFDGLTDRADYIRPGLDWLNSILSYAVSTSSAIKALTVFSDVNSYVIDIAGNVSADPLLTVGAAISIST